MADYRATNRPEADSLLHFIRGDYTPEMSAGMNTPQRLWEYIKEDMSGLSSLFLGGIADYAANANINKEHGLGDTSMAILDILPLTGIFGGALKTGKKGGLKSLFGNKTYYDDADRPFIDKWHKDYYATEKNIKSTEVMMTPDEYINRASEGFGKPRQKVMSQRSAKLIDEYAEAMKRGDKFPMPYLSFDRGDFSQEGLHRAAAAKKAGIEKIPVRIVDDAKVTNPYQTPSQKRRADKAAQESSVLLDLLKEFE